MTAAENHLLLGLDPGASHEQIREARRSLSLLHHPDRGGDPETMARINRAADELLAGSTEPARVTTNGSSTTATAPSTERAVVVLVCMIRHRDPNPYEGASVYPACQNLLLAARALGYGGALTMWHQGVEQELRRLLYIPDDVALSACITLGRPRGAHGPVRRKPVSETVFDDRWGAPAAWARDPDGTRHAAGGPR